VLGLRYRVCSYALQGPVTGWGLQEYLAGGGRGVYQAQFGSYLVRVRDLVFDKLLEGYHYQVLDGTREKGGREGLHVKGSE
jgi:hypothetical protein